MKKIILPAIWLAVSLIGLNAIAQTAITDEDRKKAIEHLKNSQKDLLKTVKGLSESQLTFKSSPEAWSIAECVEHIAISESAFFGLMQKTLQEEADPSKRSELNFSDEQVAGFIVDRTTKIKTQEPFEPKNNFGSYDGSLKEFKTKRKANIAYVKSTKDDLRNHYYDFPFGKVDTYQIILFLSGHSIRHTSQIKEVIANEIFPGS